MKKNILLVCVVLFLLSALGAQEAVPEAVYRQVDVTLAESGAPGLEAFLGKNAGSSWYPRLESYVLKKARQQVIQNELDQAKAIALAVVDVNLDNKEAVDLYQSVQNTISRRDSEQKKLQEQKAIADYKKQTEQAKIKQDLGKTYKTVTNTASGKKVYLDQDFNNHYQKYTWDAMVGLADIDYITGSTGADLKYGLSVAGSVFYIGEDYTVGADIEGGALLLTFTGAQGLDWYGQGLLSVTGNKLNKYLAFRIGYTAFGFNYGSQVVPEKRFLSPVAGVGFRDIRVGQTGRFQMAVDYYPGHFLQSGLNFAMGGSLRFSFVMAHLQDFDIQFHTGLKDTVLLYSDGLQNDAKFVLSIGVGNYE